MVKYARLTIEQRREIESKYKCGKSSYELAQEYDVSRHTIMKWATRQGVGLQRFADKPRRARASVISKSQQQGMKRSALQGKTAVSIAQRFTKRTGHKVSTSTTRRLLMHGKHPLRWLPIQHGRVLSQTNKQNRVAFCQKHSKAQVGSWVFGDAKVYHIYPCSCGYLHRAWQGLDRHTHTKSSTNPYIFMFYAFVGKDLKSKLIFTGPTPPARSKKHKTSKTFTSSCFMDVVDQAIQYLTLPKGSKKRRVVVLDRAKQHTSKASIAHMAKCGVHLLEGFPAQSWDINVIENVWGILDTKLLGARPTSTRGWREAILKAWDEISIDTINKLVSGVRERMVQVIEKQGDWLCTKG